MASVSDRNSPPKAITTFDDLLRDILAGELGHAKVDFSVGSGDLVQQYLEELEAAVQTDAEEEERREQTSQGQTDSKRSSVATDLRSSASASPAHLGDTTTFNSGSDKCNLRLCGGWRTGSEQPRANL